MARVEFCDVTLAFGDRVAFDCLSLTVAPGEMKVVMLHDGQPHFEGSDKQLWQSPAPIIREFLIGGSDEVRRWGARAGRCQQTPSVLRSKCKHSKITGVNTLARDAVLS